MENIDKIGRPHGKLLMPYDQLLQLVRRVAADDPECEYLHIDKLIVHDKADGIANWNVVLRNQQNHIVTSTKSVEVIRNFRMTYDVEPLR